MLFIINLRTHINKNYYYKNFTVEPPTIECPIKGHLVYCKAFSLKSQRILNRKDIYYKKNIFYLIL